jgi:hypothetical protein
MDSERASSASLGHSYPNAGSERQDAEDAKENRQNLMSFPLLSELGVPGVLAFKSIFPPSFYSCSFVSIRGQSLLNNGD